MLTLTPEVAMSLDGDGAVVPTVIEETSRGDRVLDLYSRLLRERVVVLRAALDDGVANELIAQLLLLDAERPGEDISLYVNSPGGSATALCAVYDGMESVTSDVATYCVGQAASAAAVVLAAGARGKRFALPHSRVLLHQPHGVVEGGSTDIETHAREIARNRRRIEEILAAHTGRPIDRIAADIDRDLVLDAEQARAYGIVDAVVSRRRLALGDAVWSAASWASRTSRKSSRR
jgi:ATP-dependent Clp protease, protease subunit